MSEQCYYIKRNSFEVNLLAGKKPLINHINIELTERCNNACKHCYINLPVHDKNVEKKELKTDQWKEIILQAAQLGALSIRITGGEPLLRPDFPDIYLFARHQGLKVILFTNGRLLTPELAELFAKVPPLKKIEISLYGAQQQTYDGIACSLGGLLELNNGINLLLEHNVPFIIKPVILPQNIHEMDEMEHYSASFPWAINHDSYAIFLDLRAHRDLEKKNDLIKNLRFSPQENLRLLKRNTNYRKEMILFCAKNAHPRGDKLFSCGAGDSTCVDAYGNYQMCSLLRHPKMVFDITNGTLYQALINVFPEYKELRTTNPDYLKRCANCFLMGLCEQCPAKSWSEHGTLDTPVEYLCQSAHAQARYLGLLEDNEYSWEVEDWKKRVNGLGREITISSEN